MPPENKDIPEPADPNINDVLDEFLADQRERLSQRTYRKYESVIELFVLHLNDYGGNSLSREDNEVFDHYYAPGSDGHKDFCEIFGPDKILSGISGFQSYFLIRKVIGSAGVKKAAGTVTKKLAKWLAENGYVSEGRAASSAETAARTGKGLQKSERATQAIEKSIDQLGIRRSGLSESAIIPFETYTVEKVEPGRLWLQPLIGTEDVGPVHVPKEVTELVEKSWDISCAIDEVNGKLRIVQIGSVYPL